MGLSNDVPCKNKHFHEMLCDLALDMLTYKTCIQDMYTCDIQDMLTYTV